jgi:hypothetical protein
VVVALFLIGFQGEVPGDKLPAIAERVQQACDRISRSIRGTYQQAIASER